jgi:hypothetical protein
MERELMQTHDAERQMMLNAGDDGGLLAAAALCRDMRAGVQHVAMFVHVHPQFAHHALLDDVCDALKHALGMVMDRSSSVACTVFVAHEDLAEHLQHFIELHAGSQHDITLAFITAGDAAAGLHALHAHTHQGLDVDPDLSQVLRVPCACVRALA